LKRLKHACLISVTFILAVNLRAHTAQPNFRQSDLPARPPAIVIGFVGGFVGRENSVHSEVQLAERLRRRYPSGVDVEVFENRHVKQARRRILTLLTTDSHGVLSTDEKREARIVLYGHSWGGAAVVQLARALQKDGIPVLLTVQVDAISKHCGTNISTIPSNVGEAVNLYQTHGLIHGVRKIRAQDPLATRIVGNFHFDYTHSRLRCPNYPWWDRYFMRAHMQIECDPVVWNKVESLIAAVLTPTEDRTHANAEILSVPTWVPIAFRDPDVQRP
jgi:hypothetical protein